MWVAIVLTVRSRRSGPPAHRDPWPCRPHFSRTVLLVLEHDEDGAMGVVLNRPTGTTLSDLAGKVFEEGLVWARPIHLGGPVTGPFTVIHAIEDLATAGQVPHRRRHWLAAAAGVFRGHSERKRFLTPLEVAWRTQAPTPFLRLSWAYYRQSRPPQSHSSRALPVASIRSICPSNSAAAGLASNSRWYRQADSVARSSRSAPRTVTNRARPAKSRR